MAEFLFLFFFRIASGLKNSFGYAGRIKGAFITTIVMALAVIGFMLYFWMWGDIPKGRHGITLGLCVVTIVGLLGIFDSFDDRFKVLPKDIHLWESVATGAMTLAWVAVGGNLLTIATALYPSLIIHKMLINVGAGIPLLSDETDDPTGKTFSIPLLNIKIPRLTFPIRIVIAIVSLWLAAVIINLKLNFSI